MGLFDIFGKGSSLSNKERMRKIRQSGKDGEEQFRQDKFLSNIERRHHGKDFVEKEKDWTGKTHETPWEVKRNNSPLSPKQKRTRNLHVRRYVDTPYGVESRTEDKHGNRLEHNIFSGKWEKVKNRPNLFGLSSNDSSKPKKRKSSSSIWGSPKKSSSKKKSDNIWGTSGSSSLFGSSSPSKRKKSSSGYDSLFGSSSSSKRKRKSDSIW